MAFGWPKAVVIEGPEAIAGYEPEIELNHEAPHVVSWQEGGHRRAFDVRAILQNTEREFQFVTTRGRDYTLRPMTLELYRIYVQPQTIGQPDFKTMEALLKAMRAEW